MSVGVDHVDIPACTARGVKVGYTPNVLTDATVLGNLIDGSVE